MTPTFKIYDKVWTINDNKVAEYLVYLTHICGDGHKLRPTIKHYLVPVNYVMNYKSHQQIMDQSIAREEKDCFETKNFFSRACDFI